MAEAPSDSRDAADDREPPTGDLFDRTSTLAYVAPMAVYLVLSSLEPSQPAPGRDPEPGPLGLTYDHYPLIYSVKLAITAGVLWLCRDAWLQWPLLRGGRPSVSPLAIAVGAVGVVLWIGCCELRLESRLVESVGEDSPLAGAFGLLGMTAERPAYNPLERIESPAARYAFVAVRFVGLALLVPVFEELLLRGWLVRNIVTPRFWEVPFGQVTTQAAIVATAFPMLYHPEKVASLVWFTLMTWLMVRTKNYWDCVAAHAVTNFLLGAYVLWAGAWRLW